MEPVGRLEAWAAGTGRGARVRPLVRATQESGRPGIWTPCSLTGCSRTVTSLPS